MPITTPVPRPHATTRIARCSLRARTVSGPDLLGHNSHERIGPLIWRSAARLLAVVPAQREAAGGCSTSSDARGVPLSRQVRRAARVALLGPELFGLAG